MTTEQFLAYALVVVIVFGALALIQLERYHWNKGVCRVNGRPWRLFDTDSQGGRGYVAGAEVLWVSWGADKR